MLSYVPAVRSFVCGFSGDLEGNIGWSRALQLKSRGREVVEVLVEQLRKVSQCRVQLKLFVQLELRGNAYVVGRLGDISESWDRHIGGMKRI